MIDMVKKDVVSAVMAYEQALTDAVTSKKAIGVPCAMEESLLNKLASLADVMYKKLGTLEDAVLGEKDVEEGLKLAKYSRETIFMDMQSLRETVDEIEATVASDYWPLPTYGEMLFSVL